MDSKPVNGPAPRIHWRSGIKYSEVSMGRSGQASVKDTKIVAARQRQIEHNLGDGVSRSVHVDRNGNVIKDATKNIDGRLYKSRQGIFTSVDTDVLDYEYELEKQIEEKVDEVMKYCIVSDNMTMRVLDFSEDKYHELFSGQEKPATIHEYSPDPYTIPSSVAKYDCRASYLKILPSDSKELSGGLAKLRIIVSNNMPILEGATPSAVIKRKENPESEEHF